MGNAPGLTRQLAEYIVGYRAEDIPAEAYEHAACGFKDFAGVALAGKDEPLVTKLLAHADVMGGNEQATIIGHGCKKSVTQAALINGAAAHALDYDDSLVNFMGHASVATVPALLALAEWKEISGRDFLTAYILAVQAGAAVGMAAGPTHYLTGWHATGTVGHLASAAGCARLLGLDLQQCLHALGIAGTQASGLKRVFGTMCKPFHAGMASEGGLVAALLAADGFDSATDILEGEHGFLHCLNGNRDTKTLDGLHGEWEIAKLAQKYHASCHATHSPIEAMLELVSREDLAPADIASIQVKTPQAALDIAGKLEPSTGLEGKFSIPYCVANAILRDTTDESAFTDEKVNDPEIKDFMTRIDLGLDEGPMGFPAAVVVQTADGRTFKADYDIFTQIPPLDIKKEKIAAKFAGIVEPRLGSDRCAQLANDIDALESIENMKDFVESLN